MADTPPDSPSDGSAEKRDRWAVDLAGVTLLGRYCVERKIGGGGMASVYLATDEQLEQPVVVKAPHPAFLAEVGFRERFERETRDLISLQHPHIVRILARGEHEGLPYLVMQFLKGGSLGDRMRKAKGMPIPLDEVGPWIREVSRALDFIHAQGIVHRDIKPDNVLFDEHGNAYLSDFGIAKAVGGADTGLTITGATPGSPAYMAPEQPRTSSLTGQSDQYSLAATIYEALSGRPTFEGETVVDVLIKKQSEEPVPLAEIVPDLPASVSTALMRALARLPERRYPTCIDMAGAMLDDTKPVEVETPAATISAVPGRPSPPPPARVAAGPARQAPPPRRIVQPPSAIAPQRSWGWLWVVVGALGIGGLAVLAPGFFVTRVDDPAAPTPAAPVAEADANADLIGTYRINAPALRERMRRAKDERHRPKMRPKTRRSAIDDLLKSDMELTLQADGQFVMRNRGRRDGPEIVRGSWMRTADAVVMSPVHLPEDAKRMSGEIFKARITPQGLTLVRRGFELPLKRQ